MLVVGSVVFFQLFSRLNLVLLCSSRCCSNNLLTILTVKAGDWCCQLMSDRYLHKICVVDGLLMEIAFL